MGRVLVGRSVVGRLWHRSLLGIYTRGLGLELPLRAATGYVPQCSEVARLGLRCSGAGPYLLMGNLVVGIGATPHCVFGLNKARTQAPDRLSHKAAVAVH